METIKNTLLYKFLVPNDIPRYIRIYDNNGETADRYTCVFTGRYTHNTNGDYLYLGMSSNPFHPQGIGQHGESNILIDRPKYSHLGKKIKFTDLPENCQKFVLQEYLYIWNITDENGKPIIK